MWRYSKERDTGDVVPEWIEDWKNIRSLLEHEDGLVNQRLLWMLTFNGFLFTALGLSLGPQGTILAASCELANDCSSRKVANAAIQELLLIRIGLALAGISSAIAALMGVTAAFGYILQLERSVGLVVDKRGVNDASLPTFYKKPIGYRWSNKWGMVSGILLPSLIAGVWAFVIVQVAYGVLQRQADVAERLPLGLLGATTVGITLFSAFWCSLGRYNLSEQNDNV